MRLFSHACVVTLCALGLLVAFAATSAAQGVNSPFAPAAVGSRWSADDLVQPPEGPGSISNILNDVQRKEDEAAKDRAAQLDLGDVLMAAFGDRYASLVVFGVKGEVSVRFYRKNDNTPVGISRSIQGGPSANSPVTTGTPLLFSVVGEGAFGHSGDFGSIAEFGVGVRALGVVRPRLGVFGEVLVGAVHASADAETDKDLKVRGGVQIPLSPKLFVTGEIGFPFIFYSGLGHERGTEFSGGVAIPFGK